MAQAGLIWLWQGGATTHNKTVAATLTTTVTVKKSVGFHVKPTLTTTVKVVKSVGKKVAAALATTVRVIKAVGHIVSVTLTTTMSFVSHTTLAPQGGRMSGGTFSRGRWHKFVSEREAKAEAKRRAVKRAADREARRARQQAEAAAKARQEQIAARAAAGDLALRQMQALHSSEALHRLFGLHQLRAHQALLQAHASAHQEADDEEALALLAHLIEDSHD